MMNLKLTLHETRVIGALIEKELTTPEQYPLSINALVNACNQKSNRDPVLSLSEQDVQNVVDELVKKHLVTFKTGFGSRVTKCQHRFSNTEFSEFQFNPKEMAVLVIMFLRGAQTPGELRSRSNRLCEFSDVDDVEQTLNDLRQREDGPFVAKLVRVAGKRESRYIHLFSEGHEAAALNDDDHEQYTESVSARSENSMTVLEERVDALYEELQDIKRILAKLTKDE